MGHEPRRPLGLGHAVLFFGAWGSPAWILWDPDLGWWMYAIAVAPFLILGAAAERLLSRLRLMGARRGNVK
ncbi:hypothetical protein [Streptomyces sp. AB3(2024)]|uniref:hypothetical protein n=1 Tax=Streptomyces sp. AB3(2024) TaxID=3317321 RepID=UPI0035A2BB1C